MVLDGEKLTERELRTAQPDFAEFFQSLAAARVVMEVRTHSAWARGVVASCGHEVLVANPRHSGGERHVIVLADALEHEERRGAVASIGDQMRTARPDGIGVAGTEPHLLLGLPQEQSEASLQDVERILDLAVAVPRHVLVRRDLEFGDAETQPLGMQRPALD